jgi:hypothetical protein
VVLSVWNFLVGNGRTEGDCVVVVRWLLVDNVMWLLVDNVMWLLVVRIHDVSAMGLMLML